MGWELPAPGAEGVWGTLSRQRRAGCAAPPGEVREKAGQGGRGRGRPSAIPGGGGANSAGIPEGLRDGRGLANRGGPSSGGGEGKTENAAGATERAWPRVGLLFTERQGGGAACQWRENRTGVVVDVTEEGEELGTNGRGGEWLLIFVFPLLLMNFRYSTFFLLALSRHIPFFSSPHCSPWFLTF